MKNNKMVISKAEFEEAIIKFIEGKPIKIMRDLKDVFHLELNKGMLRRKIYIWAGSMTPFKNHWTFKLEGKQ